MTEIKVSKSPQATRGERGGGEIVDAGEMLSALMERDGEEVFEHVETGKSFVLNEKHRKAGSKKAHKDAIIQAAIAKSYSTKLEADGSLNPVNIGKTPVPKSVEKIPAQMVESQQTVQTALAKHEGRDGATQQRAVHSAKEEKVAVRKEKVEEKRERRKHVKDVERGRELQKGLNEIIK